MKIKCDNCDTTFNRRPYNVKTAENHFCCRKCYSAWQSKTTTGVNNPHWKGKIEAPCANCGAVLERYSYRLEYADRQFCNHKCHGEWKSKNTVGDNHPRWSGNSEITCEQCGKTFRRANTNKIARNEHNFCSQGCFSEWKKTAFIGENNPQGYVPAIEKPCDFCGRPLKRKPWRIGKNERRFHFCDKQCRANWQSSQMSRDNSPLWQGGPIPSYGPKWKSQANKARKRDGNKCQHCGKTAKQIGKELDVHHIRPFRSFGYIPGENDNYKQANDLSNLITLCRPCHQRAEAGNIPVQPKLL